MCMRFIVVKKKPNNNSKEAEKCSVLTNTSKTEYKKNTVTYQGRVKISE